MKKIILNAAGIVSVLGLLLMSCAKQDVNPAEASTTTVGAQNVNTTNGNQTPINPIKPPVKGGGITVQTFNPNLAFFSNMASAYGYTFAVYTGTITPSKQGVWDYDEVYRYKQGTGDNAEVYEFTDIDAYNYAVATNDKDYWEDQNNKMHCSGAGALCTTSGGPCAVPVYY